MNLKEYQVAVNSTWKENDAPTDLLHCRYALIEEVGEIAGWYKKHYGYGLAKKDGIKTGLKEEFGDLLYYLVKTADITGTNAMIELNFDKMAEIEDGEVIVESYQDIISVVAEMSKCAVAIVRYSQHNGKFLRALAELTDMLFYLILEEGWMLEDIQLSNLAKLKVRHGKAFDQTQALPANRDKSSENNVID